MDHFLQWSHTPHPSGAVTSATIQFWIRHTVPTADPPAFSLSCVSTGGPATTVTWTREGAAVSYDANHTLNQIVADNVKVIYFNSLAVTGRELGNYTCSVTNDRTAQPATASLTVSGEGGIFCRLIFTYLNYSSEGDMYHTRILCYHFT